MTATALVGALGFILLAALLAARAVARAMGRPADRMANLLLYPIVPLVPLCLLLAIGNLVMSES